MKRYVLMVTCLLTLVLLAACGAAPGQTSIMLATPTAKIQPPVATPIATSQAASQTATLPSKATVGATGPTNTALAPTPAAPAPDQLTILHTNDNWGETEPCG